MWGDCCVCVFGLIVCGCGDDGCVVGSDGGVYVDGDVGWGV